MRKHRIGDALPQQAVRAVAQSHEPHPVVETMARRIDLAGTILIVVAIAALILVSTNAIPNLGPLAVHRVELFVTWCITVGTTTFVVTALLEYAFWRSTEAYRNATTPEGIVSVASPTDRSARLEDLVDVSEALIGVNDRRHRRARGVVLLGASAMLVLGFAGWLHGTPVLPAVVCATAFLVSAQLMQHRYAKRRTFYLRVRGEAARALTATRRVDGRGGRLLSSP